MFIRASLASTSHALLCAGLKLLRSFRSIQVGPLETKAKGQASAAKARGRAALEPEGGPGRQVVFHPDGGSPPRTTSIQREGSSVRALRAASRATVNEQPVPRTMTSGTGGALLQLEDAPATTSQLPDSGCWAA